MTESTRKAKVPLRFDWSRQKLLVKERPGVHAWRVVYFAKVDAFTVLNAWREGGYWKFVTISTAPRLILARGDAPTMHEAKVRAEASLGDGFQAPQQDFGFERTVSNDRVPF